MILCMHQIGRTFRTRLDTVLVDHILFSTTLDPKLWTEIIVREPGIEAFESMSLALEAISTTCHSFVSQ